MGLGLRLVLCDCGCVWWLGFTLVCLTVLGWVVWYICFLLLIAFVVCLCCDWTCVWLVCFYKLSCLFDWFLILDLLVYFVVLFVVCLFDCLFLILWFAFVAWLLDCSVWLFCMIWVVGFLLLLIVLCICCLEFICIVINLFGNVVWWVCGFCGLVFWFVWWVGLLWGGFVLI